ncbi:hypothetical protein NKH77_45790 [Streptomyces sp. M19]
MGAFKANLPGHYRYQRRLFSHFMQDDTPPGNAVSSSPGTMCRGPVVSPRGGDHRAQRRLGHRQAPRRHHVS